jgi:hypothetical protein
LRSSNAFRALISISLALIWSAVIFAIEGQFRDPQGVHTPIIGLISGRGAELISVRLLRQFASFQGA